MKVYETAGVNAQRSRAVMGREKSNHGTKKKTEGNLQILYKQKISRSPFLLVGDLKNKRKGMWELNTLSHKSRDDRSRFIEGHHSENDGFWSKKKKPRHLGYQ